MSITISKEKAQAIESAGYGLNGDIGGLQRQTYYTPDGRIVKAIPNIREYVKKDADGKVIGGGTRDANLDKGWLLQMPDVKKLACPNCSEWHDTQIEIETCGVRQHKVVEDHAVKARQMIVEESLNKDLQIAELNKKLEELARIVSKLSEHSA